MRGLISLGVVAGFACLLFLGSCTRVPAGHVGVCTTFGRINEQAMEPGLHFVRPFIDGVTTMETRLKSFEVTASASSKDLQIVNTVVSVQHSLAGAIAPQSYQVVGDLERFDLSVVSPAVLESTKAVTAHYTAEELITKRDAVKQQTVDDIQRFIDQTLKDKGIPGAIHVSNVAIKDFQFSSEFNASIESKVRAQQEALKAEQDKLKRITDAEAAAKERELAADAEAFQIEKVSIQRAAAIEREAKALEGSPLMLQLRAIEKWNGTVPTYSGGGQAVPFITLK